MPNATVLDAVCAVLILALALRALLRGFVRELLASAAPVLGLIGAYRWYKPAISAVTSAIPALDAHPVLAAAAAFAVVFLLVFLGIAFIGGLLRGLLETLRLGFLDRLLGLVFGVIEGLALSGLLLFLLSMLPFDVSFLTEEGIARWILGGFLSKQAW